MSDIVALLTQGFLKTGLKLLYGEKAGEVESKLATGLDGNFNIETQMALCRVGEGEMDPAQFLADFGHRGNPDWDVAAPRWREDPLKLKRMADRLRGQGKRAQAQFEDQQKVRRKYERKFALDLRRHRVVRFFRSIFLKELRYFQIYSPLRESTQSICFLWVELVRRVVMEMANRNSVGDLLFYLKEAELGQFFASSSRSEKDALICLAREKRQSLKLLQTVYLPHLIDESTVAEMGCPPVRDEAVECLKGTIVCHGYVLGRARVVTSLSDAQDLERGDILVTAFTDPAWTPLFLISGGLILEQGSSFSHGAIVAREIGLPALVNVEMATHQIRDGQKIILDGNQGTVTLLD